MTPRPNPPAPPPSAALKVADLLASLGMTHLVSLPDNTSAPILAAVQARGDLDLVLGTREGEVIALASGLWLGGAQPLVLIQNTGLLEAGDALRGTASRMGAPLLMLVTCRGFAKARRDGRDPSAEPPTREILVDPDTDSVAHMTYGTLDAWGIPHVTLNDPEDLGPLRQGWESAVSQERPVAVLIDASFSDD